MDSRIASDAGFPAAESKRTPQVPRLRWTAVASGRATDRLSLTAAARYAERGLRHDRQLRHGRPHLPATDARYFLFHPFPQRSAMAELKFDF